MKKLISLVLLIAGVCFAQDKLEVDVTKLSASELQAYQSMKQKMAERTVATPTVDQMSKYAEIGKSFGVAFKECWTTVSTDVEKFAQTDAGKLTMFLIAWKIMGSDALNLGRSLFKYFLTLSILAVAFPCWFYVFRRNCCVTKRIKAVEKIAFLRTKTHYDGIIEPSHMDYAFGYFISLAIIMGACCLIAFG